MRFLLPLVIFVVLLASLPSLLTAQETRFGPFAVERGTVSLPATAGTDSLKVSVDGAEINYAVTDGRATLPAFTPGLHLVGAQGEYRLFHFRQAGKDQPLRTRHIPLWLSIIPPLVAIVLALLFREVIISLFIGVWAGAFIAGGLRIDSLYAILLSFVSVIQTYFIRALNDTGHLSVIVFSLLIGGMVAIISRNGGMAGVVNRLSKYATTDRSAQAITWLLGVAIFFDDYANTLIVGNTMRSVTDRFKVSREKLAYVVDSTAAPVAAVAFITTWIGAELGYIDDGITQIAGFDPDLTPYAVFLDSLKYSYYPVLTLCFILFLIYQGRDFGPMLKAETRARLTGMVSTPSSEEDEASETEDLSPVAGAPLRARNAVIPVLTVIIMTIVGLIDTGIAGEYAALGAAAPATDGWGAVWGAMDGSFFRKLGDVIGSADSYVALLWASVCGVAAALILSVTQKILSLERTIGVLTSGFKTMLPAIMILSLAWSLAITTEELHTATFLTGVLQGNLHPFLLPPVIFVLAALISFSTGSSWSTMAILYPIAIPLTWSITIAHGSTDYDHSLELLFNVISTILAASVLGDHCSPISDTTILSSLASDCHHIDHVRTQLPYALSVGAIAITTGFITAVLGGGWPICLLMLALGIVAAWLIVRFVGKPVPKSV